MNVKLIIDSLRVGHSVKAKAPWKWAGMVGFVVAIGLFAAQSRGYLTEVSVNDLVQIIALAGGLFGVWSVPATSATVGVLPRRDDPNGPVDLELRRVEHLPTDSNETKSPGGYWDKPRGPFEDS